MSGFGLAPIKREGFYMEEQEPDFNDLNQVKARIKNNYLNKKHEEIDRLVDNGLSPEIASKMRMSIK